ncbi:MAG: extracellular solute-binding protein [Spirochaetota bacterium]
MFRIIVLLKQMFYRQRLIFKLFLILGFMVPFLLFAGGQKEKAPTSGSQKVTRIEEEGDLSLTGWSYAVDYAKELVQQYVNAYGVKTEFEGLPSGAKYNELLVTKFLAHEPIDVLYLEDFTLTPFIASGWLTPLSAYAPAEKLKELTAQMQDSFVTAWTVNNELYALPYYQTVWLPIYNKKMFTEAGINQFPQTWAELKTAALKIKQAGILEYPITFAIGLTWTNKYQVYSMVLSEGGRLFDEKLDPVFEKFDSEFRKILEWLIDGLFVSKFIDPKSLETDENANWRAFAEGQAAMTMIPGYRASQIYDQSLSKVADSASLAITPGKTNETVSWSRGYVVSAFTDAPSKIWTLIDFMGGSGKDGNFPGRRGWMANYALDSGYKHLWNEPDVRSTLAAKLGEENIATMRKQTEQSRSIPQAPWMAAWVIDFERELHRMLTREISLDSGVKNLADSWQAKRKRFPDYHK